VKNASTGISASFVEEDRFNLTQQEQIAVELIKRSRVYSGRYAGAVPDSGH
jgi:hypothetical protein